MKSRVIVAVLIAILGASPAFAGSGHGDRHAAHVERLAERLGLDQAQAEDVATIMREQREKYRALHQDLKAQGVERGSDEARALRQQAHEEMRERLSAVLSADQLAALDEMRAQRKGRKHRHRHSDSETM